MQRYNDPVAQIPKVPEDEFKAVMRALVSAPPMPMAEIPKKRKAKRLRKPTKP